MTSLAAQAAPVAIDLLRVVLALTAGAILLQLARLMVRDHRRGETDRIPAQAALVAAVLLITVDATYRLGMPAVPHLLILRTVIVAATAWYCWGRKSWHPLS